MESLAKKVTIILVILFQISSNKEGRDPYNLIWAGLRVQTVSLILIEKPTLVV
ncbi:MAG: hypothetical protein Fur0043_25860 [Anaerolineales bacterium]